MKVTDKFLQYALQGLHPDIVRRIPIDGLEHYFITNIGMVFNSKGTIIQPRKDRCNREFVKLTDKDGSRCYKYNHRLYALAFGFLNVKDEDSYDVFILKDDISNTKSVRESSYEIEVVKRNRRR